MSQERKPVLIELDADETRADPSGAPELPELAEPAPTGQAMQVAIGLGARRRFWAARWFLRIAAALVTFAVSVWAWDWMTGLIARNAVLGTAALVLLALFILFGLVLALRELAAFARLRRLDRVQAQIRDAMEGDLAEARQSVDAVRRLYAHRPDMKWALARVDETLPDLLDADTVLSQLEAEAMAPLDGAARKVVEAASRQVATATALVPLALADVVVALVANLRMIRQVAEIYGGHSGSLGSLRLARSVMAHLVATGAVAVGDDMIGSIAGGGLLSKLSRRFGEGVINGALTARVGIAAMELCRPMPFAALPKPTVSGITGRALAGLFAKTSG